MEHILGLGKKEFSSTPEPPPPKRKKRGRLTNAERLAREKRQKELDKGRHAAYQLTEQAYSERYQRDYLKFSHDAYVVYRPDANPRDSDNEEERNWTPYIFDTPDMLPTYVKKAYREREFEFFCLICQTTIKNKVFLDHVPTCAREKNALIEEEAAAIALYKSSDHYVNQSLYKLRERMELEYFNAISDPERLHQMTCGLCETLDNHKAGKCMEDNQKTAFRFEAKQIVQKACSELLDFWEYKKQSGLYQLTAKYAEKYEKEKALSADQTNIESVTEEENDEETPEELAKRCLRERIDELKASNHSFKRGHFEASIDKHCYRMLKYIKLNKWNERLGAILQFRKKNNLDCLTDDRDEYFNRRTPAKHVDNRYTGMFPPSRFHRCYKQSLKPEIIV